MPKESADRRSAVVLLSGGLDSSTCLAIALDRGLDIHTLSFTYGQRHTREIECADALHAHYTRLFPDRMISRNLLKIDLAQIGGSALTDRNIDVPDYADHDPEEIPVTYVPARNLILLSFATALAEVKGASHIFIGVNSLDYSGYPDCRPRFVRSFESTANLATAVGSSGGKLIIEAPLQELSKADIVKLGTELGVPWQLTWSCYRGGDRACGTCDSCTLRLRGFKEAGCNDPISYE